MFHESDKCLLSLFLALSVVSFPTVAGAPPRQDPKPAAVTKIDDFEERLERFTRRLEAERIARHVPGLAEAVVWRDELVLARGFGVSDLVSKREVTPDTIFPIGSSTKSFTAALVGILADEGRLEWDDPVTKHLPWFELEVDPGTRSADELEVTLRDLLSHRTGFVRMNALLVNPELGAEEILRAATGAEPWSPFRTRFHYSNVMYVAAGMSAGVAAESSWEEAMKTRLFDPLGMSRTFTSREQIGEGLQVAEGYLWEPKKSAHQLRPYPDATRIGPAGAILGNVTDLARWLRFQLANGVIDGTRVMEAERLAETRRPQIAMGGGIAYGLGWLLREVDGHRVVEHGGNLEGFTAVVSLFPDDDLGLALLSNVAGSALKREAATLAVEILLGEPEEAPTGPAPARGDVEDLLGEYLANYLNHKNEVYEVKWTDGELILDVPTQQPYTLEPTGEPGRWRFALSAAVEVTFGRDAEGAVTGLVIHVSGHHFEVPRRELAPEVGLPEPEAAPKSPTLEEVLALRQNRERGERIAELGGICWHGEVAFPQSGVSGRFTAWADGFHRFRQNQDLGRFGFVRVSVDGKSGWTEVSGREPEEIDGERLEAIRSAGLLAPMADWFAIHESAEVLGTEERGGRAVVRVRLIPAAGSPSTVLVDLETGDTLEEHASIPLAGGLGEVPVLLRYEDWREVEGLRMPFRIITEQEDSGRTISTIEKVETGLELPAGFFSRER